MGLERYHNINSDHYAPLSSMFYLENMNVFSKNQMFSKRFKNINFLNTNNNPEGLLLCPFYRGIN